MKSLQTIQQLLNGIYGEAAGRLAFERVRVLIERFPAQKRKKPEYFSQEDVILITYGDSVQKAGQAPIATLHEFAAGYLKGVISGIHFLPTSRTAYSWLRVRCG